MNFKKTFFIFLFLFFTSLAHAQWTRQSDVPQSNGALPDQSGQIYEQDSSLPVQPEFKVKQVYPSPYIYFPSPVPSREQMFRQDMDDLFGLTPDEIRQLRQDMNLRQRAATDEPAQLRAVTLPVELGSGSEMPTIQVTPGYVSTLVVLDKQGNPWPVRGVTWGDKEGFQVEEPPSSSEEDVPSNMILITPLKNIGSTSVSILLANHPLPVIVQLVIGRGITDARVDLRLDSYAPGANLHFGTGFVEQFGSTDMIAFLDGVPPQNAVRLQTDSNLIEVWMYNKKMVLRTRGDMVSPSWTGVEHGAYEMKVYESNFSPIILLLYEGEKKFIKVSQPEINVFQTSN